RDVRHPDAGGRVARGPGTASPGPAEVAGQGPARRPRRGEHRGPLSRLRSLVRGAGDSVNPVVRAEELGKRYGRRSALRDCSFDLPPGRVVALVGRTGAGKTALLSLAVGLLRATTGSIEVLGEAPAAGPKQLERVGSWPRTRPRTRACPSR